MDRRWFVSTLLAAAAVATLDPEALLWKPTKTIFIPPASPRLVCDKLFRVDLEFAYVDLMDGQMRSIIDQAAGRWADAIDRMVMENYYG